MTQPLVFLAYSLADEAEKEKLLAHLNVLRQAGLIDLWSEARIGYGSDREAAIRAAIGQAKVAILLLSANFFNSDDLLDQILPQLLLKHAQNEMTIIPVLARACAWRADDRLAKLEIFPRDHSPIWSGDASQVDARLAELAIHLAKTLGLPLQEVRPSDPSPTTPGGAMRPPLRHRLTRAEHFVNREQELANLLTEVQPGRVVTITGPGGIGKSALAAEVLWRLAPGQAPPERFPDGIFVHSFYTQPQAELALEAIAAAFGEEPKPTPSAAARRALSGRTALLVLDGTEEADDLSAVQAVAAGCGLLLTSRRKQDAVAQRQDLERLPGHEAVKLLQAWAQPQTIQTTIAEAICELVGGLPLAVRLVGRYLNETGESAADYLAWLQETPLEALDQGQRRHESVAMLLERSLVQVSDQARQVLSVTGILALAPFNRELVAAGLAVELKALRRLLGELVSYGLLLRREQGYEVTHALIRTYARTRLIPDGEITARLLRYFTDEVEAQSKQGGAGFRHLDSVRPHLIASLKSGLQHQFWEPLQSLAFVCGHADGYFALQGHWIQWAEIVEAGLQAARQLGQRQQEVAFMAYRGQIYHAHQNYEQAIAQYERALALSREIGFQRGEGNTLADLGGAYRRLGQPEQAIVYHEQALQLKRHLGDRKAEGNSMGSLGNTYHDLRDFDMALHYFEAALAISRELGDRRGESVRLGNIGVVYHDRGQLGEAIKFTEEALAVAKNAGDRHSEATWLANLGQFYEETGQWAEARLYYQRAVELFDAFGTPDAEKVRRYLLELEAARPKSAKEGIQ